MNNMLYQNLIDKGKHLHRVTRKNVELVPTFHTVYSSIFHTALPKQWHPEVDQCVKTKKKKRKKIFGSVLEAVLEA